MAGSRGEDLVFVCAVLPLAWLVFLVKQRQQQVDPMDDLPRGMRVFLLLVVGGEARGHWSGKLCCG